VKRTLPALRLPPRMEPVEDAPRSVLPWPLVVGGLGLATIAAIVVGNGSPVIALAPCLIALLVWGICVLPLRLPMLALLALSWTVEIAGDAFAMGKVQTPLYLLGTMLFAKLNSTIPVDALVFSGFDILLLLFAGVIVYRHGKRTQIDRIAWVEAPRPIWQCAVLALVALAWMTAFGLARGGSGRWAMWQVIRHLYLPFVYLMMGQALRGPADVATVGKIVLGAGIFRSAEALIVRQMFPSVDTLPHATVHHDSVLFVSCLAILLAMLLERPTKRTLKIAALLLPVFVGGMIANNRRLAWGQLAMVAVFFFFIMPWGRVKRVLVRTLVISLLPLLVYTAAGWSSQAGIFAPVRTFRSLFDPDVDGSTRWRDIENYDLIQTFKQNPLFGSGFGHPFFEAVTLPSVTRDYELEPYVPHNSVLVALGDLSSRDVLHHPGLPLVADPGRAHRGARRRSRADLLCDARLRRSRFRHLGSGLHGGDRLRAGGEDLRRQRSVAGGTALLTRRTGARSPEVDRFAGRRLLGTAFAGRVR